MEAEEFYAQVGKMIKERDHAKAMADKWAAKAAELETGIESLIATKETPADGLPN